MTEPQRNEDTQPIVSDQTGPHEGLLSTLLRHREHAWRKPIPAHTQRAGEAIINWVTEMGNPPVVLDSFCGTGMSTALLSERHGDAVVIGVDKSGERLGRHVAQGNGRYRLFRAECEPLWRFLSEQQMTLQHHYLLYPNPWPKSKHLKRRIHGHPGFPFLWALGGRVEVRSNWRIYIEEFALAWRALGGEGAVSRYTPATPLTLFERKYHQRDQTLWQFQSVALP